MKRLDIRHQSDEEKRQHYEEVNRRYHQGESVTLKEDKSGFPAVTIDCGDIHLLTDCLSLEAWWFSCATERPKAGER